MACNIEKVGVALRNALRFLRACACAIACCVSNCWYVMQATRTKQLARCLSMCNGVDLISYQTTGIYGVFFLYTRKLGLVPSKSKKRKSEESGEPSKTKKRKGMNSYCVYHQLLTSFCATFSQASCCRT